MAQAPPNLEVEYGSECTRALAHQLADCQCPIDPLGEKAWMYDAHHRRFLEVREPCAYVGSEVEQGVLGIPRRDPWIVPYRCPDDIHGTIRVPSELSGPRVLPAFVEMAGSA